MEKTTKKRREKSKSLKRRIGVIAVGGLSLVLTVCLSVGATLAWFAGSTWASKSLYMGGPVYVEMSGRDGAAASTNWVGGQGNLDIQAVANTRKSGTVDSFDSTNGPIKNVSQDEVLLPGQKVEIYSQARVFTTAPTDTIGDDKTVNISTGANTQNTSNSKTDGGVTTYYTEKGRVTTSTSSVLRARFSIGIEFDPSVGFNNFTTENYMDNYPVQSDEYTGQHVTDAGVDTATGSLAWDAALDAVKYTIGSDGKAVVTASKVSRRDAVAASSKAGAPYTNKVDDGDVKGAEAGTNGAEMVLLQKGEVTSIYKWRYCSEYEWDHADGQKVAKMGYPFNGGDTLKNTNGYFGLWILDGDGNKTESDAFYKARCNAYLDSYVEFYVNEYGNSVTRTIGQSITALDNQLNKYFVQLVNDSSNAIITAQGTADEYATWLYVDPTIGNDTNSNEISTSTGGWWYLVSTDNGKVGDSTTPNKINVVTDSVTVSDFAQDGANHGKEDEMETTAAGTPFKRDDAEYSSTDAKRLTAKLFEIKNFTSTGERVGKQTDGTAIEKVVSMSFPFVNGTFALPTDALTNIFANAKITFQISFQAMQAFFPYTETIDKISYTNSLLGTQKALNIANAIPIYNEAFDYEENTGDSVSGL